MAHTISLPIQFKFMPRQAKWVRGSTNLDSLATLGRVAFQAVVVTINSPDQFKGAEQILRVDGLPPSLRRQIPSQGTRLMPEIRRRKIEVLLCAPDLDHLLGLNIDPWQARSDFLSLKHSTDALLEFLNRYGSWSHPFKNLYMGFEGMEPPSPQIFFEEDIWHDRDGIREALKGGGAEWFRGEKGSLSNLSPRSEYPHYEHKDAFCLDAMMTATTVDFLRGVRFRVCARRDCGNPFPADRKGKRYCQQYCAHLVSVRKGRKAKRTRKGD